MYRVTKPEGGFYFVQLAGPGLEEHCFCQFFTANIAFCTCKHLVWLKDQLAEEAAACAAFEARAEYEEFGRFLLMAGKF